MTPERMRVRLGDVAEIITGHPFRSVDFVDDVTAIRLLRGDNVAQGWLRWDGAKHWPAAREAGLGAYQLRPNDVVLAMDRPWIEAGLKFAVVTPEDLPALLVQRVARLRGTSRLDTRFLRFIIASREFTNYILGVQTGTAVPHISGGQIRAFEFVLPEIYEQRLIADVLCAIEDKIAINRRTSETLKLIAQALFKNWFIDFDPVRAKMEGRSLANIDPAIATTFPATLDTANNVTRPTGWQMLALDQAASFLNGLALQKFVASEGEDSLPVIKIAQLRAGHSGDADRANLTVPLSHRIDDGDLVFSWSGTLMIRLWVGGLGALNQHLFKVTSTIFPRWFIHGWLNHHLPKFQAIAADKATTMGHIQRHHLTDAQIIVPPPDALNMADSIFTPLEAQLISNEKESRTLRALRDEMLPRLLSGEMRVRDAECETEATV